MSKNGVARLLLVAAFLVAPRAFSGDDKKDKDWKPIQITWHGHSFFEVKSSKGTNIVLDPHLIPAYGRPLGIKAAAVTISHNHNDHTQVGVLDNVKDKDLKIIRGLKGAGIRANWDKVDTAVKDVRIHNVGVYHDGEQGLKYGKNSIFILDLDGWRVVHLGDLGHQLSREQLKQLGKVDVLMIPVGGIYTINGNEAKKIVEQIKPREYIFPMHCGTKIYDELLPADEFLEDQPRANVTSSLDNTITLNRDPQRPRPLIVNLNYWPRNKK
ncbi:MAG: MBL fold metallo-hydrolase [Planctomycetes bacterium]|nr:MBL fold metallo-hydrolase [Planctomycetota bacterium]